MNDKNVITFSNIPAATPSPNTQVTRAKSFKINSQSQNYSQYINTVKAYAQAGLPFEHIANAGDHLGDGVERGEMNASLKSNWQDKIGEVAENENQIMAWQNRGETISITHSLAAPSSIKGSDLVTTSNNLTTSQQIGEQTLNVVEGISVTNQQQSLPQASSNNSDLQNNPFLRAPANLK